MDPKLLIELMVDKIYENARINLPTKYTEKFSTNWESWIVGTNYWNLFITEVLIPNEIIKRARENAFFQELQSVEDSPGAREFAIADILDIHQYHLFDDLSQITRECHEKIFARKLVLSALFKSFHVNKPAKEFFASTIAAGVTHAVLRLDNTEINNIPWGIARRYTECIPIYPDDMKGSFNMLLHKKARK
jgi:hypothetical protein